MCWSLVDVEKSKEFTKKLGHKDCKGTNVWMSQWKSKHDIKLKNAQSSISKDYTRPTQNLKWHTLDWPEFAQHIILQFRKVTMSKLLNILMYHLSSFSQKTGLTELDI